MAKTKGGLTKWFKQDWVDIGAPKRVVALLSVAGQNKRKMPNESTLSVSLGQKLIE